MQGQALSDIENYMLSIGRGLKAGRGECPLCGHDNCFLAQNTDSKGKGRWLCVRTECAGSDHNQSGQKVGGHDLIELVMMHESAGYVQACNSLGINADQSGGGKWRPPVIAKTRVVPAGAVQWSREFPRLVKAHRTRKRDINEWAISRGWPDGHGIASNLDVAPWPPGYEGLASAYCNAFGAVSYLWIAMRNDAGEIVSAMRLMKGTEGKFKRALNKDSRVIEGPCNFGSIPDVVEAAKGRDREVYVVEGSTDYVSACAIFGREKVLGAASSSTMPGLIEALVNALKSAGARPRIVMIPDDDKAGRKAVENCKEALIPVDSSVLKCIGFNDISDAYAEHGHEVMNHLEQVSRDDADLVFPIMKVVKEATEKTEAIIRPANDRIDNTQAIMDYHGVSIRSNMMSHKTEFIWPDGELRNDNESDAELREICRSHGCCPPERVYQEHMLHLARMSRYHPVKDWILSEPWDGVDRIGDLLETVTLMSYADVELCHMLIKRWLASCVAACMSVKGIKAEGCLTFTGDQGSGKTSWIKSLATTHGWVKVSHRLDTSNKDNYTEATAHWIVELGELDATFKASSISELKSFLSQDTDTIRTPHARHPKPNPRRTVFFGSVNGDVFLRDRTGNRRYWVIPVHKCDYNHTIDTQQLWAQVHDEWVAKPAQGKPKASRHWLIEQEIEWLNRSNDQHTEEDPLRMLILEHFEMDPLGWIPQRMIRDKLFDGKFSTRDSRAMCRELRALIKEHGLKLKKSNGSRMWPLKQRFVMALAQKVGDDGLPF